MSKVKSPPEKKRLSLSRDRRNVYGEAPHAARKAIPKRKAVRRHQERRAARQTLGDITRALDAHAQAEVEDLTTERARAKRRAGFKKAPDEALGLVIQRDRIRRAQQAGRRKRTRAPASR